MCGRFGVSFQYRDIKALWKLAGDISLFSPHYNIAPLQEVPVVVRKDDRNELRSMRWGLVPSWSQDCSVGQHMINARAETLLEKPSFKNLVASRRCLVPTDGFYEWRREGSRKLPMWIYLKSRKPFAFPRLWDSWHDRDTGNQLYTFTIYHHSGECPGAANPQPYAGDLRRSDGTPMARRAVRCTSDGSPRRAAAAPLGCYGSPRGFDASQLAGERLGGLRSSCVTGPAK